MEFTNHLNEIMMTSDRIYVRATGTCIDEEITMTTEFVFLLSFFHLLFIVNIFKAMAAAKAKYVSTHRSNAACKESRHSMKTRKKAKKKITSVQSGLFLAFVWFVLISPSLFRSLSRLSIHFIMNRNSSRVIRVCLRCAHSSEALLCVFIRNEFIAIQFNGIPTAFSCNAFIFKQ